ncbi:MAG: OmpA family protein [Deltaproteobacteria bacterium]|nr:OmpA family protein [Deltaproteobacteria bacterium]TDI96117.1 MAG: OmpA family protein [Deltaproteobacteria bacterium]
MKRNLSVPGSLVLAASLAIAPLTGCVTQSKYDLMLAERDELAASNEILRQQSGQLTRQSQRLASVAAGLSQELALRDEEVEQLTREQEELMEELETWVVAGLIKMELLKDGLHLVLSEEILFPTGSDELSDTGREVLTKLVEELEQLPYQIAVIGYTDNVPVGPRLAARYPSNWELAGARAASVVRLFQGAGVPAQQLLVISRGESQPIASNDTPEGRAENRRIEVRLRPVVS